MQVTFYFQLFPTTSAKPQVRCFSSHPPHVKVLTDIIDGQPVIKFGWQVTLPALSPTMEMGSIVTWEKKGGDKVLHKYQS